MYAVLVGALKLHIIEGRIIEEQMRNRFDVKAFIAESN